MASLYDRFILPRLLTCACSSPPMMKQRTKIVPKAEGRVLELGIGMGLNLQYYDPKKVTEVMGVDPSPELREIARNAAHDPALKVTVENGTAEALPLADKSFDTVVCTFTLCSVCTPEKALAEARRVLKPGGRLLLVEPNRRSPLVLLQAALVPAERGLFASTAERLRRELGDAGFLVERERVAQPFPVARVLLNPGFGAPRLARRAGVVAALRGVEWVCERLVPRRAWLYLIYEARADASR